MTDDGHNNDNNDNNDDDHKDDGTSGSSESPLDDLFVEGARFREPSAAERAAWAKEQRKELKKSKRRRSRERPAGPDGAERGPRSGKRGAIALVVLFALTFVVFYVFNPGGGGGGGDSSNNATLLATQPREIAAYYAVPKGVTPDPGAPAAIRHDLEEVQSWLASQTGGKVLRFRETPDGGIDVQPRELSTSADELKASANADGLVHDAFLENGQEPDDIVLAFVPVDRGADCGQGQLGFAVVYIGSCGEHPSLDAAWPGGDTKIAAHELMHALGAVAPCAPHYGDNGHVTDTKTDLMYPDTGGSTGDGELDPGHDDYYKHDIKDCIDIARHPAWMSA